jgi:hypothetical protein
VPFVVEDDNMQCVEFKHHKNQDASIEVCWYDERDPGDPSWGNIEVKGRYGSWAQDITEEQARTLHGCLGEALYEQASAVPGGEAAGDALPEGDGELRSDR